MSTHEQKATALIMAGGTGGHIFPGLAVAQCLQENGWHVEWLGSKGGMEESLVAKHHIQVHLIGVTGLRGNGVLGWIKAPLSLSQAILEARKVIKKLRPDVVVGFGGFASGPGGIAAFLTNVPLVIHEQNAVAGMTNKILAKVAKQVFQAFPKVFSESEKVKTVGNPIRRDFKLLNQKQSSNHDDSGFTKVLVVGGSRGALALNKWVPQILKDLINDGDVVVRHQVGKARVKETTGYYETSGVHNKNQYELLEFIDEMAASFEWADVLICRAGASTVAEVAAAGVCAVFVPFPYAVDDHQTANANWLVKQDAALLIAEKDLNKDEAIEKILALIGSKKSIKKMASNAKAAAYLESAEHVAEFCEVLRVKAA